MFYKRTVGNVPELKRKYGKDESKPLKISVADTDPDVSGSPGSGSISTMYGPGSGSSYHEAKIERKTMIPIVLWLLYDFLS
jgi:hypothetical protein